MITKIDGKFKIKGDRIKGELSNVSAEHKYWIIKRNYYWFF